MAKDYSHRKDLAKFDVRHIFTPGDAVLLKQREIGKFKCRARGPFTFVKYTGKLGTGAVILNHKGKERNVSATNLLPVHPPAVRINRFSPAVISA
jgi:hypothetical protein